jgi:hypothetical protein
MLSSATMPVLTTEMDTKFKIGSDTESTNDADTLYDSFGNTIQDLSILSSSDIFSILDCDNIDDDDSAFLNSINSFTGNAHI